MYTHQLIDAAVLANAEQTEQAAGPDFLTIGMLALLALMIFFMVRSGRKRKQQAAELQDKMLPGSQVMTSSGIFGTLLWIDEDKLQAGIEVSPGVELIVHRQTLAQVVEEEQQHDDYGSDNDAASDSSRED